MVAAAPERVDARLPEHRISTFLDFYSFHLERRAHPGCVYYLIPYLREREDWSDEELLWYCILNGNTQNPVTSWLLHQQARTPRRVAELLAFWRANRTRLAWDTDRRYHRTQLDRSLYGYLALTHGRQAAFWRGLRGSWGHTWAAASSIPTFGRLSAWSYAEYLYIAGYGADADDLMVRDPGSKSHRNGLLLLAGDDWQEAPYRKHDSSHPEAERLTELAEALLEEAWSQPQPEDWLQRPTRLTLESALCTYKSWHKPDRRYPNVYNDMLYERIRQAEERWPEVDFGIFWDARLASQPADLLLEYNPGDPGLDSRKQNHYRETGEPVVMYRNTPRESDFDRAVRECRWGTFR